MLACEGWEGMMLVGEGRCGQEAQLAGLSMAQQKRDGLSGGMGDGNGAEWVEGARAAGQAEGKRW